MCYCRIQSDVVSLKPFSLPVSFIICSSSVRMFSGVGRPSIPSCDTGTVTMVLPLLLSFSSGNCLHSREHFPIPRNMADQCTLKFQQCFLQKKKKSRPGAKDDVDIVNLQSCRKMGRVPVDEWAMSTDERDCFECALTNRFSACGFFLIHGKEMERDKIMDSPLQTSQMYKET